MNLYTLGAFEYPEIFEWKASSHFELPILHQL